MTKYSVRKYYFIDTVVEAEDAEDANDKVNNLSIDLSDIEYLGDLEYENPDIAEL
jgi:hypothetical protein